MNLYHAIEKFDRPELKWLNLKTLSLTFLKKYSEELINVFYFSSLAVHTNEHAQKRQKAYIRASELIGIKVILGNFKGKNRSCPKCSYNWIGHEEKETDVNIALSLLDFAYQNAFDRAIVISNDSDLAPAIRMVRSRFPQKKITTISPPHYFHSIELIEASSDKSKIRIKHLERSLLPEIVSDPSGLVSVSCPQEYKSVARIIN